MAKRTPALVSQYLEGISSRALEQYAPVIRGFVGRRNGIYALYKGHRLYYVGLATNLRARLRHHLKDRHRGAWDTFSVYLTVGDYHLRELESLAIRIASPKGNSQKGGFRKADNLARAFRRSIKKVHSNEIARLITGRVMPEPERSSKNDSSVPLAEYVSKPFPIRYTYKGRIHRGHVRRDGRIRFKSRLYNSPSKPASRIRGGEAANGWFCWQYERAPSDWVPLDTLRR
jgi:hypothetical protein